MSVLRTAGYSIRRFRPADRESAPKLFERLSGGDAARFEWKFEQNPTVDHVPVYVAERRDQIVGAASLWPLRLRLGDVTRLALQPCDAVVRRDYRGRGLEDLLFAEAIEDYRGDGAVCIDFRPTPIDDADDWTAIDQLSTYYRIHDPGRLFGVGGPLAAAGRLAVRSYHAACDRIAPSTAPLSVDRYETIPPETFASLYRRSVPAAIHALRDEAFYRWRYRNPDWEYEAYLARRDGEPVAGAVVASRRTGNSSVVRIVDRVPLVLADGDAEAALLDAVVTAHADAGAVAVHQDTFTHRTLSRFGFQRDDAVPLASAGRATTVAVRSSRPSDATSIGDYDLTDADDWLVGFAERHPY
ncbi:Acetyltransferase (GNAT) domain-containing protein [Natronoarchaeum philippinense]|uniref:Acetyltransferase (GNAT) domain-containing protein n=1 Tax=Natronoarchaeum philippinense TaxID=558529 RepID=A0A285N6Q9_NATPI|nr:GNAT family N-acetyltransferase [Natronoarchaeum philippinense]SNZ03401.1 Acetyltransferase (GNAT) domain-containing protein [Natronoarchaeum philippinense]